MTAIPHTYYRQDRAEQPLYEVPELDRKELAALLNHLMAGIPYPQTFQLAPGLKIMTFRSGPDGNETDALKELLAAYRSHLLQRQNPTSMKTTMNGLKWFRRWAFATERKLSDVTFKTDLEEFARFMVRQGLAPTTAVAHTSHARGFLEWLRLTQHVWIEASNDNAE